MPKPRPIVGTPANETIGTNAPYSFRGAGAQAETIYGGDGNDTIFGLGGNDLLFGDKGGLALPDNSIVGDNNDTLFGGDGSDTLFGEQGNDNLFGGNGTDSILGSDGNDTMSGDAGEDSLRGGNGTDGISGGDGNDTMYGDAGDDTLDGGNGADNIFGSDGSDALSGGGGNDAIDGGAGTDTASHTGAWIDYRITVVGATATLIDNRGGSPDGTDTVTGVESFQFSNGTFTAAEIVNDAPAAVADSTTVLEAGGIKNGTPGVDPIGNVLTNDTDADSALGDTKIVQGVAAGTLAGPLGSGVGVTVVGSYGRLVLQADGAYVYMLDNGNPTVEALNPGDQLTDVFTYTMKDAAGQTSTATLTATIDGATDTSGATIVGDDAPNTLLGTGGDDTILGLGGDDQLFGRGGADHIDGGDGNDIIDGDYSYPVGAIDGSAFGYAGGDDEISGGGGNDIIYGDGATAELGSYWVGFTGGSDAIGGGDGDDTIYGDQFTASAGGYNCVIFGGSDDISGGNGNDIISGDQFIARANSVYDAIIQGGNDSITGGSGDDTIYGDGASADVSSYVSAASIIGGDDNINAGSGADTIYGDWAETRASAGTGGTAIITRGHDRFIYLNTGDGGDTIGDFRAFGEDSIDVSAIDANAGLSGDQAFGFAGTAATNYSIWFSDNGTDTTLYFDNNGDATADMNLVLLGVHGTDLSLADFVA